MRAYLLAIAAPVVALGLAILLHGVVGNAAVLVFLLAVTGAALFLGLRPALVATVLSLLLIDFFLLYPTFTLAVIAEADVALLILFVLVAAGSSWMAERVRHAREIANETAARAAALAALMERQLGEAERDVDAMRIISALSTSHHRTPN